MTFEQDFPSLKGQGLDDANIDLMFSRECIQENCLDRKRFEEAIKELKIKLIKYRAYGIKKMLRDLEELEEKLNI